MSDHYNELGVPRDADADAIKKAYRAKAKANHPDRGGDGKAMARINAAHDVLSNPTKRERYDRTGEESDPNQQSAAESRIASMFDEYLMLEQEVQGDLIALFTKNTQSKIRDCKDGIVMGRRKLNKLEKRRKRIVGSDLFVRLAEDKVLMMQRAVAQLEDEIALCELVIEMLKGISDTGPVQHDAPKQETAAEAHRRAQEAMDKMVADQFGASMYGGGFGGKQRWRP